MLTLGVVLAATPEHVAPSSLRRLASCVKHDVGARQGPGVKQRGPEPNGDVVEAY